MTSPKLNERPLKLFILNEFFYPDMMGGSPKLLSEIAEVLQAEHNVEVNVITSRNSYRDDTVRFAPFEDWRGIKIHRVEAPHWSRKRTHQRLAGNLIFTFRASRLLKSQKDCDVVLVTTAPTTLPIAALRAKKPYAYLVYDLDPDRAEVLGVAQPGSRPAKILRKHQTEWMHKADKVLAIGRCMRDYLEKTYRVPQNRLEVVEVGAHEDTVRPLPRETAFRKKHNIESFVVLYTGNFGKYHDFDAVLDAAKLIKQKGGDVLFVLVGSGAKKEHLENRIANEQIDNVRMYGFVPDEEYADLLATGDLCLVTLEKGMEGLCVPSKFYSILAAGRPTLASMQQNTEIAYVINESDCGIRVDIGDVEGLAKTILDAKANPDRLNRQGKNARDVFERHYTTRHVTAKLYDILLKMAGRSS